MKYKFFDKEFLVLPDDEDIIGKKVFYNGNLPDLIKEVEQGDFSQVATLSSIVIGDDEGCFGVGSARWLIAYYDPNYECKVAYSQGKQIQYRTSMGKWLDVVDKPLWCVRDVYRVKPEEHIPKIRRMTNRELAKWCADNKGQYAFSCASCFYTSYSYCGGEDTTEVADSIRIRAWDEDEWHEPLVEVKE